MPQIQKARIFIIKKTEKIWIHNYYYIINVCTEILRKNDKCIKLACYYNYLLHIIVICGPREKCGLGGSRHPKITGLPRIFEHLDPQHIINCLQNTSKSCYDRKRANGSKIVFEAFGRLAKLGNTCKSPR